MALTLANTLEILDEGTKMLITDTTVYGGANALRANVFINFLVQDMRTNPPVNITPDYDAAIVESILVAIPHDGWYNVVMSLTPAEDAPPPVAEPDQLVKDELVTERFCICKANFTKKTFNCKCGCENKENIEQLYCMSAQFEGIKDLVAQNDMLSADKAIERLNKECALANKGCCG